MFYVISYDMRNTVDILADHEEFYWDVNGTEWNRSVHLLITNGFAA